MVGKISEDPLASVLSGAVMAGVQDGRNVRVPAGLFPAEFDTVSSVEAAQIDASRSSLRTTGYTEAGDGGAATYVRVGSEPSHSGKIQSDDGAWWELADPVVNVKTFGAVGDGSTDDTDAFSAAAKSALAFDERSPDENSSDIPHALVAYVRVERGTYKLTEHVDVGGRNIYWILDNGTTFTSGSAEFLNGSVVQARGSVLSKPRPYGIRQDAAGSSVIVGTDDPLAGPEITGIGSPASLSIYTDRDIVASFAQASAPPPTLVLTNATYDATHVYPATPISEEDLRLLRKGMVIDTAHTPTKRSGIIADWADDGTSIEVETGWYPGTGSAESPVTPSSPQTAYVNPVTKVWVNNSNLILPADGHANKGVIAEWGFINETGETPDRDGHATGGSYIYCLDLTALSGEASAYVYARGGGRDGYVSSGQDIGFRVRKNVAAFVPDIGYLVEISTVAFEARDGDGNTLFKISGTTGTTSIGNQGASQAAAVLDWHCSGRATPDARFQVSGGSATQGTGVAQLQAGTFSVQSLGNTFTNSVQRALRVQVGTSGTPAAGIGVGVDFRVQTATANNETGAAIDAIATDVTDTSEDFDMVFSLMAAGAAAAEKLRLKSTGQLNFRPPSSTAALTTNGEVTIELTNNTTLTFRARGSDGTTRSGTITLS